MFPAHSAELPLFFRIYSVTWEAQVWSHYYLLQLLFKDAMQNGTASTAATEQSKPLTAMGPKPKHLAKDENT